MFRWILNFWNWLQPYFQILKNFWEKLHQQKREKADDRAISGSLGFIIVSFNVKHDSHQTEGY
jgi:hypothetical protein